MGHYSKEDIYKLMDENDVTFIRLQFTDITGMMKNVAITKNQLKKALNNQCVFDGSSLDGFARDAESDMCLHPDRDTFTMLPWRPTHDGVARFICDVYSPDGEPYDGDPRRILKKEMKKAEELGIEFNVGPECEFFLFEMDDYGRPTTQTRDTAGYFDLGSIDIGGDIRREICLTLESMGFEVEASHHEAAVGQHEIDFKYDTALKTADNIMTFKMAVKSMAKASGGYATFMPKPRSDVSGSGMHLHMSLMRDGKNLFDGPDDPSGNGLSETAYRFMAGLLAHARALTAVCNPTVNSYKRLASGYEAPVHITWSCRNRSPLVRIPSSRGKGARIEFRSPDPSANPYLMLACCLAAGLDGVEKKMTPPPATDCDLFDLPEEKINEMGIETLPLSLIDAMEALKSDPVIANVLGGHALHNFLLEKEREWARYTRAVTDWEIENYLQKY
ncbi:Glutamine synthetase [Caprobacter fermentans]|uniref:Glutamine synthetase n=1 Tax=Caproicibacter fermentans TaxID=2576756 RepID=A0A6N8HVN3_9FIRM|nr:type I glutamate--ammonia ligase [Caproicibacter fermentans]MVB09617.1 Glutamine synthetase [Caproicibacter fermentans]QNK40092.1 type I glutamate--ammonia ligase [Caproicibacter fermentans]